MPSISGREHRSPKRGILCWFVIKPLKNRLRTPVCSARAFSVIPAEGDAPRTEWALNTEVLIPAASSRDLQTVQVSRFQRDSPRFHPVSRRSPKRGMKIPRLRRAAGTYVRASAIPTRHRNQLGQSGFKPSSYGARCSCRVWLREPEITPVYHP